MNTSPFPPQGVGAHAVTISRVAENQWHAIENDLVAGRAHASRRLDGRTFVSIDTWRDDIFDRLAAALVADQSELLHTVVDENDRELLAGWERAGFATSRREYEFVVPTAVLVTPLPSDVSITAADEEPLRLLDEAIRAEVEAAVGWHTMPAEVLAWQGGTRPLDPSKYLVAIRGGRYVGLVRVATRTRRPRIGLVAVRTADRRRGIGRALLSHTLQNLLDNGYEAATAEVDETNKPALALFEALGARLTGTTLELTSRPEGA